MTPSLDSDALRALAQFCPFEEGGDAREAAHDDLVASACQTGDGGFKSLDDCRSFIAGKWKIDLEVHEIEAARTRLEAAGRCTSSQRMGIALTPEGEEDLLQRRQGWEQAAETAIQEWEEAVRREYPLLSNDDIVTLRDQLRPWIDQVITRHGAEASLLLYPSHPRAKELTDSVAHADLGFLPECSPALRKIRPDAFRLLVRKPTNAQRQFLGRLLNTGFYLTVLSLDPRAGHLAKAEAKGTVIYLDTNFLYAVLGVGSAAEAASAKRLMELCSELGYSMRVTPWTIDELRTSIRKSRTEVTAIHQSEKAAQVMAEVSGEKGFVSAFWREKRDRNVSVNTFFGKYEQYRRFLEGFGIKEHPQGCAEVDADVTGLRQFSSPLEGLYGVASRPRVVIEHKAKMRMLIEQLRGSDRPSTFSDVRFWFLTESTTLPSYGRMPIESGHRSKFPFCILSSSLAQVVRTMVPRTDDLNDMMVGLLASPYVGYASGVDGVSLKAVERVVARIDALDDVPPAVAVAMVNDEAMAAQVGGEVPSDRIDELVEARLSEKAKQLEFRVQESASQVVEAERTSADARLKAEEADLRRTDAEAARTEAEKLAEDAVVKADREAKAAELESRQREESEEAAAKAATSLKEEIEETKSRERQEREGRELAESHLRIARIVGAILLVVGVGGAGAALLATGVVSGWVPTVCLVACASVAGYLGVRLVSDTWAKEVLVCLTIVGGVVTIAAAIFPNH